MTSWDTKYDGIEKIRHTNYVGVAVCHEYDFICYIYVILVLTNIHACSFIKNI